MKKTLLIAALLLPTPALANLDADAQIFTNVQASGSLSGPLMLNGDIQTRISNDQGRLYELQLTSHIGYKFSKKVTGWLGYRHVFNYRDALPVLHEHRIRPYVTIDLGKLAGGSLQSRTIVEFRWRDGVAGTGTRFRQQFKWSKPFKKGGKTQLVLSHEDFIGLTRTSWQQGGYNRMRNFIGVNVPLAKDLKGEFGYLNQWDIRRGATDRMAHAASLTLSYSF